ncbi:hypothetical protein [Anoxynatronum sibiricum]|uniref:hypothetical protein n=1 Tax=Anoxynatronum sibiricum TaxID=210623 RepID=UPI0031B89593
MRQPKKTGILANEAIMPEAFDSLYSSMLFSMIHVVFKPKAGIPVTASKTPMRRQLSRFHQPGFLRTLFIRLFCLVQMMSAWDVNGFEE